MRCGGWFGPEGLLGINKLNVLKKIAPLGTSSLVEKVRSGKRVSSRRHGIAGSSSNCQLLYDFCVAVVWNSGSVFV